MAVTGRIGTQQIRKSRASPRLDILLPPMDLGEREGNHLAICLEIQPMSIENATDFSTASLRFPHRALSMKLARAQQVEISRVTE